MDWEQYKKIADQHGATVQEDTVNECENRSACAGNQIFLGQYDDEELRDISFFHELGHVAASDLPEFEDWPYWRYGEAIAWRTGLDLAAQLKITFSDKALSWAAEQLATYFYDHNSEGCPTEFLPQALQDAGLMDHHVTSLTF